MNIGWWWRVYCRQSGGYPYTPSSFPLSPSPISLPSIPPSASSTQSRLSVERYRQQLSNQYAPKKNTAIPSRREERTEKRSERIKEERERESDHCRFPFQSSSWNGEITTGFRMDKSSRIKLEWREIISSSSCWWEDKCIGYCWSHHSSRLVTVHEIIRLILIFPLHQSLPSVLKVVVIVIRQHVLVSQQMLVSLDPVTISNSVLSNVATVVVSPLSLPLPLSLPPFQVSLVSIQSKWIVRKFSFWEDVVSLLLMNIVHALVIYVQLPFNNQLWLVSPPFLLFSHLFLPFRTS